MNEIFMRDAIDLALKGFRSKKGGPFGAVVVKDGKIVGRGQNLVTSSNDPTAHAEIVAIRDASKTLNSFFLADCDIYSSCEPCPMCLSAIYWARIGRLYFAAKSEDAAKIGFDDDFIYKELEKPSKSRSLRVIPLLRNEALSVFEEWTHMEDKIPY